MMSITEIREEIKRLSVELDKANLEWEEIDPIFWGADEGTIEVTDEEYAELEKRYDEIVDRVHRLEDEIECMQYRLKDEIEWLMRED